MGRTDFTGLAAKASIADRLHAIKAAQDDLGQAMTTLRSRLVELDLDIKFAVTVEREMTLGAVGDGPAYVDAVRVAFTIGDQKSMAALGRGVPVDLLSANAMLRARAEGYAPNPSADRPSSDVAHPLHEMRAQADKPR